MKNILKLILIGGLLMSTAACDNDATTSASAPSATNETGQATDPNAAQTSQDDATSQVRREQLESDIRAREQRDDATGGDTDRTDDDLASEVRSKLEANIPNGQLVISAKDGAVEVSGSVPTQEQLDGIEPLVKQIDGVSSVNVRATVVPVAN